MTARRAATALLVVSVSIALSACGARRPEPIDRAEPERSDIAEQGQRSEERNGRTETDAAVAAAVRFVCSGQRLLDTSPTDLAELIGSMWSARSADAALAGTMDQLSGLRERLGVGVGPTRFRQAVLAVRVDSASAARVVVSVWWVGVLSRADAVTPQAQWSMSTVTMVSESGEWKVDAESTETGPLPDHSVDSEPITHAEMERRLTGFVDWSGR